MNYSYTINISPKKYIASQQWGKYSQKVQKELLIGIINSVIETLPFIEEHKFIFELTKKTEMVHAHGTMCCDFETIDLFRSKIHKKVGMPNLDPQIACFVDFSKVCPTFWQDYMDKEQQVEDDCLFRKKKPTTAQQYEKAN